MNNQDNHKSLGQLISTKRQAQGLTQFDLAEQLRVSDQAVSKWERNLSRPSLKVVSKLMSILTISDKELVDAQRTTPSHYKALQLFGKYLTFVVLVVVIVLSIATATLLVLDKIDLRNAVIMIGVSVAGIAIVMFDLADDRNDF